MMQLVVLLVALLRYKAYSVLTDADLPSPPHSYVPPDYNKTFWMDGLPVTTPELQISIFSFKCTIRYGCSVPAYIQTDIGACRVKIDTKFITASHGVFFHWQRFDKISSSAHRRHGQFWVLSMDESPGYSFNRHDDLLERMNNEINVLMSYERSSDIYIPFDYAIPRPFPLDAIDVGTKHKTKMIVAIIKNCHSPYRNVRLEVWWLCLIVLPTSTHVNTRR
jgi:hypothetical protein